MTPTVEVATQNAAAQMPVRWMTAEELFRMPRDGRKRELVKGELRVMPPTGFEHGAITSNVTAPLHQHVKANQLGVVVAAETGYFIAREPDTVRAPDVSFVSQDRIEQIGVTKKFFPEAPDLAVEVLSPGDTVYEVDEKIEEWLESGVKLVWVVNPKRRTVTVYRSLNDVKMLTENDELDGEDVVPGFRYKVADIFT
jgi:Uma2 family endonuclease